MNKGLLIVLHGATGVGKTSVAIELSRHLGGVPILSHDSRQFYREMTIGTAVPTPEELSAAQHYFIHDRSVHTPLSAGGYENEALTLLDTVFKDSPQAIMVGGTGLYAHAITHGLDPLPGNTQVRNALNNTPLDDLLKSLLELDPAFYHTVDRANRARVQRAVEVCMGTGQPYSTLRTATAKERPFRIIEIALERPRDILYERINRRVEIMVEQGLEQEALALMPLRALAPLQTVGYREFFDYFDGKTSRERAIELIKQNTRHYAKRQMTFIRSNEAATHLRADNTRDIITHIASHV